MRLDRDQAEAHGETPCIRQLSPTQLPRYWRHVQPATISKHGLGGFLHRTYGQAPLETLQLQRPFVMLQTHSWTAHYNLGNKQSTTLVFRPNTTEVVASKPMETLAERLDFAMRYRKLTQEALADRAGTSQTTIFKILSGKTKESKKVPSLSKALDCPADWLGSGLGEWPAQDTPHRGYHSVRFFGSPNEKSPMMFAGEWLNDKGLEPTKLTMFVLLDESMHPNLPKNSMLLINHAAIALENGKAYLILWNEKPLMKRFFLQLNGQWNLRYDNPDKTLYPDDILTAEEISALDIIGQLVTPMGTA